LTVLDSGDTRLSPYRGIADAFVFQAEAEFEITCPLTSEASRIKPRRLSETC